MIHSVCRSAFLIGLLAVAACGATDAAGDESESSNAAVSVSNHPGPNYIVEEVAFEAGTYRVVGGLATVGATELLEDMGTAHSPPGQTWVISGTGELQNAGNPALCVDVTGANFTPGVRVETWACNGGDNQKWSVEADTSGGPQFGTIRPLHHPELCLDATGGATGDGTVLELWDCNGQTNQRWGLFSAG